MNAYQTHNGEIGIPAKWLYEDAKIISKDIYDKALNRGQIISLRNPGPNTPALVQFRTLRKDIKAQVIEIAGEPDTTISINPLEELIKKDGQAIEYFDIFRKDNGEPLTKETKIKYVHTASILGAMRVMINEQLARSRSIGLGKTQMWKNLASYVNRLETFHPHYLPGSARKLQIIYDKYLAHSYDGILHGGLNNVNRAKIVGDVADWWLAMYSMPNKPKVPNLMDKYNAIRESKGWPTLTEVAVILWLNKPENKRKWMISRDGKAEYSKLFGNKMKRDRTKWFPNAYWALDGTKLDWLHYYDNSLKMAAKLKINPLVDVYSEKIIGWSYSETENHTDHFSSIKMACAEAQCRPYVLTYDGQSGHTSSKMQEIYDNIIARENGTHYKHQAYKSSNPMENILGRFQQQNLNQMWWSDKQSIKAKSLSSQPNIEFINKNKHLLKTREQLIEAFEYCVNEWNNAKHPHFEKTRNEVYQEEAPHREELDIAEMVQIFWVKETAPILYRGSGLQIKVAGKTYQYEVYDTKGKIDIDFREKYVGDRFQVRYDPELMEHGIQLWKSNAKGKTFIAIAELKRAHETLPAFKTAKGEAIFWEDFQMSQVEYARDLAAMEAVQKRTGITPEQLIEDQELAIKMNGLADKQTRSDAEANKMRLCTQL